MTESTFAFECGSAELVGILHEPAQPRPRGVLFVVGGGPQYRCGGHRQLTLWARQLCDAGYPVLRFDYRGMGDSHGDFVGFEGVDGDIKAAIDRFFIAVPNMQELVLWGECDAASAILFYAYRDSRVKGVVLLNPWARTQEGQAKAILRFYYLQRLMQPSFWKKVLSLRFNPVASIASALKLVKQSTKVKPVVQTEVDSGHALGVAMPGGGPLPERLLMGMTRFKGPVLLVLSGRDLIAREFDQLVTGAAAWQEQFRLKPVTRHDMPDGDHTFSSKIQRNQVVNWGLEWLGRW